MKRLKSISTESKISLTLNMIGRLHILLLEYGGLIAHNESHFCTFVQFLLRLQANACFLFFTSTYFVKIITTALEEGTYEVDTVAEWVGMCGAQTRFVMASMRRNEFLKILRALCDCCDELSHSEIKIVRSFVQKSLKLCYFYTVVIFSMNAFYLANSQLASYSSISNHTRFLPYAFCADVQISPWYEILVVLQTFAMASFTTTIMGVDTAIVFFIMVICGLYKSLAVQLEEIARLKISESRNIIEKKMVNCVVFHQQIIGFCKNIEELTSALYMSQLVSTSYNMSLLGFRLVQPDADVTKYISVLSLLLVQQFLCQWGPDVLVSESESFAQSTYFVPNSGYVNKRTNQLIHIMMIKCQHPIHLTAGGFFKLSMKCFGSLVTNAISFFMVLQTINSEK